MGSGGTSMIMWGVGMHQGSALSHLLFIFVLDVVNQLTNRDMLE